MGRAVRACGTSLVRWMARTARRLALQCAALKRHARRLALQCTSVREAHCAQATGLLLNLRSPRDCGSCRSRLWYFLSPLDGGSVREAHCAQASVTNWDLAMDAIHANVPSDRVV